MLSMGSGMNAILNKTMQSLETALRYNPTSTDLMAALAEVYIRMGRFDERTLDLCRQALEHQVETPCSSRRAKSAG